MLSFDVEKRLGKDQGAGYTEDVMRYRMWKERLIYLSSEMEPAKFIQVSGTLSVEGNKK